MFSLFGLFLAFHWIVSPFLLPHHCANKRVSVCCSQRLDGIFCTCTRKLDDHFCLESVLLSLFMCFFPFFPKLIKKSVSGSLWLCLTWFWNYFFLLKCEPSPQVDFAAFAFAYFYIIIFSVLHLISIHSQGEVLCLGHSVHLLLLLCSDLELEV